MSQTKCKELVDEDIKLRGIHIQIDSVNVSHKYFGVLIYTNVITRNICLVYILRYNVSSKITLRLRWLIECLLKRTNLATVY